MKRLNKTTFNIIPVILCSQIGICNALWIFSKIALYDDKLSGLSGALLSCPWALKLTTLWLTPEWALIFYSQSLVYIIYFSNCYVHKYSIRILVKYNKLLFKLVRTLVEHLTRSFTLLRDFKVNETSQHNLSIHKTQNKLIL